MPEEETIFSSKIKYNGIFSLKDFYLFCYKWLTEETNLIMTENKYSEKIVGDAKDLKYRWTGFRKLTDYFKFKIDVQVLIVGLKEVEIQNNGAKVKTNRGTVEMRVKGILERDYEGKFEKTAGKKFLRSIYEKWIIPSRIEQFEEKIIEDCDEYLNQAKAFLDLEGKK